MNPDGTPTPNREAIQHELEARRQATGQVQHSHRWLILGGLVAVAIIGAVIFALASNRHPATPATHRAAPQPDQTAIAQPDTTTSSSLQQYAANGKSLAVNFAYPASWSVKPPSNTSDDQPITATSPRVSILGADGKATTGKVVVSIRAGGSTLSELAGDKATAAQGSAQIAYDKPTSVQHQYPYLTFIHLAGGSNPTSAFEEIIVTGVTNFTKDQVVYQTSLTQLNPIVTTRFYTCNNNDCSVTTPLSISNSTWLNDSTCRQVLALLQSLQIN